MSRLTFKEDSHEYFLDGRSIPSVTTILRAVGLCSDTSFIDEWYGTRGTLIHKACHIMDTETLDWKTVDPEIAGFVSGWALFKKIYGPEIVDSELMISDEEFWFAGTLDKVILLHEYAWKMFFGKHFVPYTHGLVLVDIKSGKYEKWQNFQVAGYAKGNKTTNMPRATIHLTSDGSFSIHPALDENDINVFLSAVTVFHNQPKLRS